MVAAQNQPSTPVQQTVISEIITMPVSAEPNNIPQYPMPSGFPWGMPLGYMPVGYQPQATEALAVTAVMSMPPPVVHTIIP